MNLWNLPTEWPGEKNHLTNYKPVFKRMMIVMISYDVTKILRKLELLMNIILITKFLDNTMSRFRDIG